MSVPQSEHRRLKPGSSGSIPLVGTTIINVALPSLKTVRITCLCIEFHFSRKRGSSNWRCRCAPPCSDGDAL